MSSHRFIRYGNGARRRAFLICSIMLLVISGSAHAAAPTSQAPVQRQSALAVGPAITEQVLTPGMKTTAVVRVTNTTSFPLPIKGSVKNLTPLEDLLPTADKATYDASSWFDLSPADFILQPNQTKDVAISISPPKKAAPGGHYATVYFQPLIPDEALSPSTAYLNARVGVLAFLIVRGKITEQARIGQVSVNRLSQHGPISLGIGITNAGNVHMLPEGQLTIRDMHGTVMSTQKIPYGLVLPQTVRKYQWNWDNKGKIGYYTAQVRFTYGADKTSLQTTTVGFWIIPWLSLGITLTAGALITWFVVKTRHRWKAVWQVLRGHDEPKEQD
ncbi:MAG: exported protein of unknown function [Candidatus Saccharibacteria bacterium]|nr:exported protein of unknown function [Candidatus Saccharibacteria bacterium]